MERFEEELAKDSNRAKEISNNKITKEVMNTRVAYLQNKGIPESDMEPYEIFEYKYYKRIESRGFYHTLENGVLYSSYILSIEEIFEDDFDAEYNEWKKEQEKINK